MNKKLFKRENIIILLLVVLFAMLIFRLGDLTIVNGEYYKEKALNNRIKKIPIVAKRGEIFDRNGNLLAGNIPVFTVQFFGDNLSSDEFNRVAIEIIDLLNKYDEKHIEFPIIINDKGEYVYSYDINIQNWLNDNGYEGYVTAKTVFENIGDLEQISDDLDVYKAQNILLLKGIKLPISVVEMKYLQEMYKENFLLSYGLSEKTNAEDAFEYIRNLKKYSIDESISDEDVIKILTIRHANKEQGYMSYTPIKIADNISQNVAILIQEMGMDFSGINVEIEPIRYYPNDSTAAHTLGYLGKISSGNEISHYIDELGYGRNDLIGKTGIESKFEDVLRGDNGYRFIEVDAYGRYVRDVGNDYDTLQSVLPEAGNDVMLTLDFDLQKKSEEVLEKWIKAINSGGAYENVWGNVKYEEFDKVGSGAVVVVDVNTGEVLALANYPSYDPNLFSLGISQSDWEELKPENQRNPISPRPLYNTATLTAVQPGSTFKMVTATAALEQGLDPEQKIYSDGYIEIGNHTFGCWIWNDYHMKHGPTNLYEALEVSCNYYFFNISMGTDYKNSNKLDFVMNATILIEYAKKFGLDEASGIEIAEIVMGVPDEEKKTNTIIRGLKIELEEIIYEYFPTYITDDEDRVKEIINEITSWADENPTRGEVIKNLIGLGAYSDYYIVEKLADIIKYDYLNRVKWFEGDTFNMAIGQGDHQYTPIQMARYIMAIANDGYLYELSITKELDGDEYIKNIDTEQMFKDSDTLGIIRKGMYEVAQGDSGTARKYFYDFPIEIGAKTGTAEKEGNIPPADEEKYIIDNLKNIDESISAVELYVKTREILENRNEEVALYEKQKDETTNENKIDELENKIDKLISRGYLTTGNAMRQALKDLSELELNDTIINQFREDYDSYAWFVGFAPYENPEIAIVVLLPQGGHGGYAAPIARDIMVEYFKLDPNDYIEQ